MRRRLVFLTIYTLCVGTAMVGAVALFAQDDAPDCDLSSVETLLNISLESLTEGDNQQTLDALADLQREISVVRAACAGLAFDSQTEGQSPVIGPITLDAGVWISTVETESFFIAQVTMLDGSCDWGFGSLYNLTQGQAVGGAEKVIQSEGCTVLLEISNTHAPWTLAFEKVA